jgi:hypothetical protein
MTIYKIYKTSVELNSFRRDRTVLIRLEVGVFKGTRSCGVRIGLGLEEEREL